MLLSLTKAHLIFEQDDGLVDGCPLIAAWGLDTQEGADVIEMTLPDNIFDYVMHGRGQEPAPVL
jgi:hypothetical protein